MAKNIIFSSLTESFSVIWKNKLWFLFLIIIQLAFFAAIFAISNKYLPPMLENAKAMLQYISDQKFDEASMAKRVLEQKNILGDDPAAITRYFNEVIKNFRLYLIYFFILTLFFSSILWAAAKKIIQKENFKFIKYFRNIFPVMLFYLGLIFLFFYLSLNISFSEAVLQGPRIFIKYVPFLVFSAILAYFMFISIALASNNANKELVQKTLSIGIKKAHYVIAAYVINALFFFISISLMAYFIKDKSTNFFIVILSLVLFVLSFVFGRVFVISIVNKLEET